MGKDSQNLRRFCLSKRVWTQGKVSWIWEEIIGLKRVRIKAYVVRVIALKIIRFLKRKYSS